MNRLQPGDVVRRYLGGVPLFRLTVDRVEDGVIHCGDWKFDQNTLNEIDEKIGWTAANSGGYIRPEKLPPRP